MTVHGDIVNDYLAGLPEDRRAAISEVRQVILHNLQPGFAENVAYGMIGYCVPHSIYPKGYHCNPKQPLPFAALGNQKNHMALHLMCLYGNGPLLQWFTAEWAKTGKSLNMGKACIRFKKTEDLAVNVLAELLQRVTVDDYIGMIEGVVNSRK